MEYNVLAMVIAHFVGDFLLQTAIMADTKYKPGWSGAVLCTVHVFIYTVVILLVLGSASPLLVLGIFVPHWVIDRYSLAYRWMQLIGRASLLSDTHPTKAAFGAIIYVVIDQTFHLISLTILFAFL